MQEAALDYRGSGEFVMRLTKNCRYVLDVLIANPPELKSSVYNAFAWMSVIEKDRIESYAVYMGVLSTLAEGGYIEWIDGSTSEFMLTEKGKNYKELKYMEIRSAVIHESIGFALGVGAAIVVKLLVN